MKFKRGNKYSKKCYDVYWVNNEHEILSTNFYDRETALFFARNLKKVKGRIQVVSYLYGWKTKSIYIKYKW